MEGAISEGPFTVANCVPLRDLSRSPAKVLDTVERDGKVIAISRYGRIAALLVPVPERLVLEIDNGTPIEATSSEVILEDVPDLGVLASRFLVDAASTPTGYWFLPDSAHRELTAVAIADAFWELQDNDLAQLESGTRMKITRRGRAVARALARRGVRGYAESAGGGDGEPAHLHAAG